MPFSIGQHLREFAADGRLNRAEVARSWRLMTKDGKQSASDVAEQVDAFRRVLLGDDFVDGKTLDTSGARVTETAQVLQARLEYEYETRGVVTRGRIRDWENWVTRDYVRKNGSGF